MKPLSTTCWVSTGTSTTIAIKMSASLSSTLFAVLLAASVLPVMNVNNEAVMLNANNRDRRYRRNTGGPRRRRQRRRSPPSLLPLVALFILSWRTCDYECRRLTKILDKRVWRQWYLRGIPCRQRRRRRRLSSLAEPIALLQIHCGLICRTRDALGNSDKPLS